MLQKVEPQPSWSLSSITPVIESILGLLQKEPSQRVSSEIGKVPLFGDIHGKCEENHDVPLFRGQLPNCVLGRGLCTPKSGPHCGQKGAGRDRTNNQNSWGIGSGKINLSLNMNLLK